MKENSFLDFMREYVAFFDEVVETQKEQLNAIMTKELTVAEKTTVTIQSYLKRLSSMEKKRIEMQKLFGFDEMTFREIIDKVDDSEKGEYERVFNDFSRCVSNVAFYNNKSQMAVKSDLVLMGAVDTTLTYTAQKQHDTSYAENIFNKKA